ncbi:GSCFA domain-containing protein [Hwangdonia lutea]|uniref:GSCFA domain-containing protein n=1 Tax=Hwangdonia lutea TaxID=3075823 RepID=A0AA97EMY0_9FLAO|nr:GSCFA domain-containing protein [Hwangdonia sp. SCSIO 19198]WOD44122.1 GSCFA domain-containing protein [Hwangdonia sp. SCSIO 19198]
MKLQTEIPLQPQQHNQIDYNSSVLLLGSCFVENIGKKLDYFKFKNLQNPFGILFHPKAIETLITNAINEKEYTESDIFFHNEQWHSFNAHSKLSQPLKEGLLKDLNKEIKSTNQQIHDATHIIVTLGTAWIYRHIKTNTLVANCHKVPQKKFLKELLVVDEITESLQSIITRIRSVNKKVSIIFTVSPVRHIKDGFIENTQSKAHLIAAIHQVVEPRNHLHYFPSYEIMMDELRDYRFYNEDMLHPNQTAINYIWDKFQNVWVSKEASKIMGDVDSIQKGLLHKPFNQKSEAHQKFLQNLEVKKVRLQKKIPHIKF